MSTSTNTSRNSDRQASYQPGGDYESWNSETGRPNRDHDYSNGRDNDQNTFDGKSNEPTAQQSAIATLRGAENSAAKSNQEPSYFTGKGKGEPSLKPSKKNKKISKRGIGAILTIIIALSGMGAFLGASNSLLAPALSSLLTGATQTSYTSYFMRTQYLTRGMMNGTGTNAVTNSWTGSLKYGRIPNYMKTRLANQGIEVIGSGNSTKLRWNNTDIDADQFVKMFNENVDFRNSYMAAKRGRVATFFDNIADKIYKKLGISRNLFSNYKQTNDLDTDVANYKNTAKTKFEGSTTNLHTYSEFEWEEEVEVKDPDTGEITKETIKHREEFPTSGNATTGSADASTAKGQASSMIRNVAGAVGEVGSAACTVMKIGSMIATAAAAQEMYQSINYFMVQMESISKMMAGYGDASAVNSLLNFLSTSTTTEVPNYNGINFGLSENSGVPSTSELSNKTETGAPMEASGLLRSTSDAQVSSKSTENYSLERIIKTMGGAAAFGAGTALTCAGVDIATSVLSLAVTLSPAGLVKVVGSFITDTLFKVAVTVAAANFFQFLVPTIAQIFFTNAFDLTGIPAGQMLMRGASAANTREGRSGSGQSPSSMAVANAYNRDTNTVLALEAESDRNQLSPFDISNRNTFFGSIAYSLLPTLNSGNMTGLASFLRSTSKSLSTLVGKASAEGSGTSYMTTYGDCPLLAEIGAVGDLYCNPVTTTDMSTSRMLPGDAEFEKYSEVIAGNLENCDNEGNCSIKKESELAYYINYCDNRDSPFGIVDQNILSAFEIGNAILNSMPIIGDVLNIINAVFNIKAISWANGMYCGNTEKNNEFWNSRGKYYQRYIEDQRILEQMGAYEGSKNPVTAYEEAYEEQYLKDHPEANTYIGYLSRISGLTLENTETVLAFVTYYDFVNNYDPSTRIAMDGGNIVKTGEQAIAQIQNNVVKFENGELVENPIEDKVVAYNYIVYTDVRNRSYAV